MRNTDAEQRLAGGRGEVDIGYGLCVRAYRYGVLGVVNEAVARHADCSKRVEECVDRTVTFSDDFSVSVAVMAENALKSDLRRSVVDFVLFVELVADERVGTVNVDVL